jgi:hypothetical protein
MQSCCVVAAEVMAFGGGGIGSRTMVLLFFFVRFFLLLVGLGVEIFEDCDEGDKSKSGIIGVVVDCCVVFLFGGGAMIPDYYFWMPKILFDRKR